MIKQAVLDHGLVIEAMNASLFGVSAGVLLYMICRKGMYNWRDFGIVGMILVSVLLRFTVEGIPPQSHVPRMTLLNLIFVAVLAMVWARPSRIPQIERRNHCSLKTFWVWISGYSKRGESAHD